MTPELLGYPLQEAVGRLQEQGYFVEISEARSRKGLQGGEQRVVRQRQTGDARIRLTYSTFGTSLNIVNEQDAER